MKSANTTLHGRGGQTKFSLLKKQKKKPHQDLMDACLLEVYKETLEKRVLPPTMKQTFITIITKKGKDPRVCKRHPVLLM